MNIDECIKCGGTAKRFVKDGETYYRCENNCPEYSAYALLMHHIKEVEKEEVVEYAQRAKELRQKESEGINFNELDDETLCKIEDLRDHLGIDTYKHAVLFAATTYLLNVKRLSALDKCLQTANLVKELPTLK